MVRNAAGNAAKKTVRCGSCGFEALWVKPRWRWMQARQWGTGPMHWRCDHCGAWNSYPHGRAASEASEEA